MELLSFWTAIALVVSIPIVLLAFVGLSHILSFTRYNLPIVPKGARGKDEDSRIVESRNQVSCQSASSSVSSRLTLS